MIENPRDSNKPKKGIPRAVKKLLTAAIGLAIGIAVGVAALPAPAAERCINAEAAVTAIQHRLETEGLGAVVVGRYTGAKLERLLPVLLDEGAAVTDSAADQVDFIEAEHATKTGIIFSSHGCVIDAATIPSESLVVVLKHVFGTAA